MQSVHDHPVAWSGTASQPPYKARVTRQDWHSIRTK